MIFLTNINMLQSGGVHKCEIITFNTSLYTHLCELRFKLVFLTEYEYFI